MESLGYCCRNLNVSTFRRAACVKGGWNAAGDERGREDPTVSTAS
jgi:hypothetical protein